jgi:hypothetical protein
VNTLNEIEHRLMTLLLDGELAQLNVLRRQLEVASVADRDFSGVGFFTHFQVPPEVPRTEPLNFVLGDVSFQLFDSENGGEALLFVKGGVLDVLEAYNWTDEWPTSPILRETAYLRPAQELPANPVSMVPSPTRDMDLVRREIAGSVHERPSA